MKTTRRENKENPKVIKVSCTIHTHIYMHPRVRAVMSISVISVSMSIIIRHETFSDHELNRSTMGRGEML